MANLSHQFYENNLEEKTWQSLQEMPLDALEQRVNKLQDSLQQAVNFVRDQEEEVLQKLDEIDKLRVKLNTVTGQERAALCNEILDQENHYNVLAKTVIGQRRNLERLKVSFNQHQQIFLKRQQDVINQLEEAGLDFYVGSPVSNFPIFKRKQKFTVSYPVIYALSATMIFLLTLPSVMFRVSPLSIWQALGDRQSREAIFSGNTWKLQHRLQEIKLQQQNYADLED